MLHSDDGSVADRDALARWIRRAKRRAGLEVTGRLHILRHTFCSRLAMHGATANAIQELAGHVSLSTTQRYMHLSRAAKANAIRMLEGPIPRLRLETVWRRAGQRLQNIKHIMRLAVAHGNRTRNR